MPFILIKGHFAPETGIPDGDSVRFVADDPKLWAKLQGVAVRHGTAAASLHSVQLRLEGIDAIEKHAIQPLANQARDHFLDVCLGHQTGTNPRPLGYILTRETDDHGRPISFAFAGEAAQSDGTSIHLDAARLKLSANFLQMQAGYAYPLYYNTLFAELRNTLTAAYHEAKRKGLGYWPTDATQTGVSISSAAQLSSIAPIWPKLWRRLEKYLRQPAVTDLSGFVAHLSTMNERVDLLDVMEERGLQDLVSVSANAKEIRMTQDPVNLRVVSNVRPRARSNYPNPAVDRSTPLATPHEH